MRGGRIRVALMALGAAVHGCSRVEQRSEGDGGTVAHQNVGACVPEIREKLGVSFVRVCGGGEGSFWVSATPLGCSAGEHGTLRCPPVVSLLRPPAGTRGLDAAIPGIAAVVDAELAHRVCAMRFAGRLPTRAERTRARVELGLATAILTYSNEIGGHRSRHLAEWVTERPCAQPSSLGPECGAARFPWDASPHVSWALVVRCAPRPAGDVPVMTIDVDGECPSVGRGLEQERRDLPCAIRGPGPTISGSSVAGATALTCEPPTRAPLHTDAIGDGGAAFRCVIPEWL